MREKFRYEEWENRQVLYEKQVDQARQLLSTLRDKVNLTLTLTLPRPEQTIPSINPTSNSHPNPNPNANANANPS